MTSDNKPKKLSLQDQWAEEQRQKRGEIISAPTADSLTAKPIEVPHIPTPQERADNAKKEADALRAEADLEAVRNNYQNYKDAVIKLETERKAFEVEKLKYPDMVAKERQLNEREAEIEELQEQADKYYSVKRLEGDNYLKQKVREGDLYYKTSQDKWLRDNGEEIRGLKELRSELQTKIDIYKTAVIPFTSMMIRDSNLLYKYLSEQIYPILDSSLIRLLGGIKRDELKEQARLTHDSLFRDATNMLNIANQIKEKR
jgi:hypothetical protein